VRALFLKTENLSGPGAVCLSARQVRRTVRPMGRDLFLKTENWKLVGSRRRVPFGASGAANRTPDGVRSFSEN
jgi:hypothetical protein